MTLHEFLLENFAGDLEYHPRRAVVYLIFAACAMMVGIFTPQNLKTPPIPLAFALGSLTLLLKAIFLLRKSSEGLGLKVPSVVPPTRVATNTFRTEVDEVTPQLIQDFGAGPMLLWPLLKLGPSISHDWSVPPAFPVFALGAMLFTLGWGLRTVTSPRRNQ